MSRTEPTELCVLCLLYRGDEILIQHRNKADWKGWVLPGGHVEHGESIVRAVIREMQEESGYTIEHPQLCGIKQFPIEGGRYLVPLFKTDAFTGTLRSSEEGEMRWVRRQDLHTLDLVADFDELLSVFDRDDLTEFQYVGEPDDWTVALY